VSRLDISSGRGVDAHLQIRRLALADAAIYRDIRLEALTRNPEAFGSTLEMENAQPLAWFAERLGGSDVLAAFAGAELLGIAGFFIQQGQKQAHKGVLWGMYVRPSARRAGVGRRLCEAIIDLARQRVELIQLTVASDNKQAWQLYASLGFLEYGLEKNALKQDGKYYDEVLMAKDLLAHAKQISA
jgi:ribosomal protein S18 acetylase RimI-like enzyme